MIIIMSSIRVHLMSVVSSRGGPIEEETEPRAPVQSNFARLGKNYFWYEKLFG